MTERLPCPPDPTDGYARTILEHHGIRARGVHFTPAQLLKALRELGYDVGRKAKGETEKAER